MYKFDPVHPPLMKDYNGDVFQIAEGLLKEVIGTAKWATSNDQPIGLIKGIIRREADFLLTRARHWVLTGMPEHYAEDLKRKITIVTGYSETQRHSLERSLETKAGASGFGLSAEVKASLKMTDETIKQWHKEKTVENEHVFRAGHTYCTWNLVETFLLHKTAVTKMIIGGKVTKSSPPVVTVDRFDVMLSVYEDKWKDPEALALQAAMTRTGICIRPQGGLGRDSLVEGQSSQTLQE